MVKPAIPKSRKPMDDRVFDFINYSLLALILFLIVYPFYYTVILSFSEPATVARNEISFAAGGLLEIS
jgi:putative aldouronate transport system permease protein